MLLWVAACAIPLAVTMAFARGLVAHRIQPLLRSRIVNTLGERFGSPVALDGLSVRYDGGFQVDGRGLRVQSVLHGIAGDAARPMLRVEAFHFRVGLFAAISDSPRIHHVRIRGVQLDLPATPALKGAPIASRHEVDLEYAEVDDAHVHFASASSDRAELVFDVPHLELRGVSRSRPIRFKATVDNGTPLGLTETQGTIGPWNFDDPRLTPITGTFAFRDKDVSSVRGLRGRLALDGRYDGMVGNMRAHGTTSDPAFGLDVSSHPMHMQTQFAFTLDAMSGTLVLQELRGHFGDSAFTVSGTAIKNRDPLGFRLDLNLHAPDAHVEDVLALITPTAPPLMRGGLALDGRLQMRAGGESVSRKLSLQDGRFHVSGASFNNAGVQADVNGLAERARGNPKIADANQAADVTAAIVGEVGLRNNVLHFQDVHVSAPGATALIGGTYALEGTQYVLDGTVRTDAKLSHMTTGVKSVLLRPFDGLFGHHSSRAGATLPLHISGVGQVPHVQTRVAGITVKAPGTN